MKEKKVKKEKNQNTPRYKPAQIKYGTYKRLATYAAIMSERTGETIKWTEVHRKALKIGMKKLGI